jgi:hypothetical protein
MLLDMEKTIAELLEAARKLPPGDARQNALKEIGRLRARLDDLSARSQEPQSAK